MKKFFMAFAKKITRSETRFQKYIAISYAKYYLANIIWQILFTKYYFKSVMHCFMPKTKYFWKKGGSYA